LKKKFFVFIVLIAGSFNALRAQTELGNLEFIENKGQWDNAVRFRAEMPNTIFFLQKHGFSVLLQSPQDMEALRQSMHGIPSAMNNTGSSGTRTADTEKKTSAKSGGTSTMEAVLPPITETPPGYEKGNGSGTGINLIMHSHFYQVEFLNSSEDVEIKGDKSLDTYNNYFIGNDSTKWRPNCKIYQAVIYKDIYPNIDLRYYTENNQLKYDLVVHPGGNPDNIILKYKGADKLLVKNGQITIHTSVGDVKEMIPRTYEFSKNGNKDLECVYKAGADNTVHFHVTNYSPDATLIIDPTLIFSSFTGSHSDNWGYTATYDESGNFYSGSITLNSIPNDAGNGFPTSPGAYQTVFKGGDNTDGSYHYDITILKFSSNGVNRLYATYLGGSGNEQPHSLVVDGAGNLVIAGRTSSPNFPNVNSSGTVDVLKGGYDIILTKLNGNGSALIGSRIIGGKLNDGVNIAPKYSNNIVPMGQNSLRLNYGDDGRSEVILDKMGNVYLASCTSSTDLPVTPNAFQKTNGGKQDGVFIKTSPDLSNILACSYLGGNNDDAAFALALNPNTNEVYIVGGTSSTNLAGTSKGGVVSSANQGGIDGFLSIISNDGGTLNKTSYFGTSGTEVLYGVQFDNKGYPYIMGTTTGTWPVINAAFSQARGKQFIAKLRPDISGYIYSTTFGKGAAYPDISPTAFLVDRCENVYVAGWGGGIETEGNGSAVYKNSRTTGLTTTSNAIKTTTDGDDFYFFVMKKDAVSQLYGSFFGQNGGLGDHVDGGTSRFDKQGVIYEAICANCYGQGKFPTTPNVWSPKNGTGINGCNLAAVKIAFNFAGVAADPRSLINGRYDSSGCVPLDVLFRDTVHNAKLYIWSFGDGTPDTTTLAFQVTHTYTNIGTYQVRLIAIDSTTCNIADTAYLHIRVRTDKAILNFDITKLPPCQSLNYLFTNVSTSPPGKPFQPGSFSWIFGDGSTGPGTPNPAQHTYAASGTYIVQLIMVDTNYCNYPDTAAQTLRVSPVVKAQFETPDGCAPYTAIFNNTTLAGQSFLWNFGDGTAPSTDVNPVHIYADTGTFTVSLLAVDSNTCNIRDSITLVIHVHPKPTAIFNVLPQPPEYNTPNVFYNNSVGATHYVWLFGDGDSTHKSSLDTVIHQYEETNTFNACLVAINQFGCADTACHPVESLINPLLDVPNAFTPGRFGENSIVMVKGFGIATMDWKIYNRWGQVVFETNNPFIGWDGTYRGNPQPMDVYAYTLDATFFDGTKTRRKGDITLIR
jgi:gliding motility-associated-like protein